MPIQVLMPALSPTMEEGTLAKWHVKEGDNVSSGDILAEIETDKATMEVEAVDEGVVGKIIVSEGTEGVKVNETIAVILEDGEDAGDISAAAAPAAAPAPTAAPAPVAPASTPSAPQTPVAPAANGHTQANDGSRVFASPLAKRMAMLAGLDLSTIQGSGPKGRIVKRDIEAASKGGTQSVAVIEPTARAAPPARAMDVHGLFEDGSYEAVPHTSMRKTVARRLSEAKQTIPHFYLTIECEIDQLLALRKELNAKSPEGDQAYKISVNDFIIRAASLALRRVPEANASWTDDAMLMHSHVDMAVAVAVDGGLITPIIREAENKGLSTIAREMKDLAGRAHDRKLLPHEYQGGTFSISNLGMFGIKEFSAVVNPPHGGILAIGAGEERPVVRDGAIAVATMMSVTMSCDHRVIDGAIGARFLDAFKGFIQDPLTMML